jgi:hypothetical protein
VSGGKSDSGSRQPGPCGDVRHLTHHTLGNTWISYGNYVTNSMSDKKQRRVRFLGSA